MISLATKSILSVPSPPGRGTIIYLSKQWTHRMCECCAHGFITGVICPLYWLRSVTLEFVLSSAWWPFGDHQSTSFSNHWLSSFRGYRINNYVGCTQAFANDKSRYIMGWPRAYKNGTEERNNLRLFPLLFPNSSKFNFKRSSLLTPFQIKYSMRGITV